MTTLIVILVASIYGTPVPQDVWTMEFDDREACQQSGQLVLQYVPRSRAACVGGKVDQEMIDILLSRASNLARGREVHHACP